MRVKAKITVKNAVLGCPRPLHTAFLTGNLALTLKSGVALMHLYNRLLTTIDLMANPLLVVERGTFSHLHLTTLCVPFRRRSVRVIVRAAQYVRVKPKFTGNNAVLRVFGESIRRF